MTTWVYHCAQVVGAPDGPGVNELEFLVDLAHRVETLHVVAPLTDAARREIDLPDERVCRLPAGRNRLVRVYAQWRAYHALRRLLRAGGAPAVCVARAAPLPVALWAAMRRTDAKLVLKTQTGNPDRFTASFGPLRRLATWPLARLNLALHRALVARAAAIDVCTEEHRRGVVERLLADPSLVTLVPNATNVERFSAAPRKAPGLSAALRLPAQCRVVGFVGGSPWVRGGRQVIDAVAELRREYPDLHGVVVGHDETGQLAAHVTARDVQSSMRLLGRVPYAEVPALMGLFDVGLALDDAALLALVGSSNQKIRQYLAVGVAVVASRPGNGFIDAQGIGRTVADVAEAVDAVRVLLARSDVQAAAAAQRAREYAAGHLSIATANTRRLATWRAAAEGTHHG